MEPTRRSVPAPTTQEQGETFRQSMNLDIGSGIEYNAPAEGTAAQSYTLPTSSGEQVAANGSQYRKR